MISFVYFDVGGVAMFDFSKTNKWEELKAELGVNRENNELFEQVWAEYAWDICLYRNVETLLPILREKVGLDIQEDYSLMEGFLKRFQANHTLWPVIHSLKQSMPVGLLTNMYPRLLDAIKVRNLIPNITWDTEVDSSIVGFQKPDDEMYKIAEEKAGVPGSEILFVENTESHIEAAKKRGWQTFLYDPGNPEQSTRELGLFIELHRS